MGRGINTFMIVLLAGIFFSCHTVMGQNNPYKVNDQLYAYFQKCNQIIKDPKVMLMADTLFRMAAQKGDVKAQCLALNLKSDHYYYTDNISSLLTEKEKVAAFARKTPYTQYVFGAWNRIITYYLRHREYELAFQELKKYQDEAILLNDTYGIGQSYIRMGDAYFQQRMPDIAITQYKQAVDFYKSTGKENELYYAYNAIGSCYTNLVQYDEAIEYTIKAIDSAPGLSAKVSCHLNLFRIYTLVKDFKAAEKIQKTLTEYNATGMLKSGAQQNFYIISSTFFYQTDNLERALEFCDSIQDKQISLEQRSRIYARAGDYKQAYSYLLKNLTYLDSLSRVNNTQILNTYNALFNNQKLELEKNRLTLQNTEMHLKQMQDQKQIILMEKERTRIELENRNLQLEQQRTATELEKAEAQKQRLEVIHKQEELQRIELETEANQRKALVIFSILVLISGFSFIYAVTRRQHARRLQIEKEAAEKARREAEKADKLKSAFLQNLSHEIRTPLNAIVGFNDVLNDGSANFGVEERQELLSHLHTNTDLLLTLVNDVLDLSKLESGNYNISLAKVSLPELCQATVAGVTHRLCEGVKLELKQPQAETVIITDAQRLQQILTNLLVNACKYTKQGSITLAYEVKEEKIFFSVTDTGCGIDREKSELIFQRFEKLDSFKPGFGLGLSICRSLTSLLGGQIYLDTNYAGGARFIVELPLQPPA